MRRLSLTILCAILLLPSLTLAQLSTRVQREIEACVAAGDSLCAGGSSTSISQGGGSCAVDASGNITCEVPASGTFIVTDDTTEWIDVDTAAGITLAATTSAPVTVLSTGNATIKNQSASGWNSQIFFNQAATIAWAIGNDAVTGNTFRIAPVGGLTLAETVFALNRTTRHAGFQSKAPAGVLSLGNYAEGQTAMYNTQGYRELVTLSASAVTAFNIPSGARMRSCQMNVNDTVVDDAGDDTWTAALSGGSTTAVTSGATAAAINTKVNKMFADEITTGVTNVTITPQGGSFTGGIIEVLCFADFLTAMADA